MSGPQNELQMLRCVGGCSHAYALSKRKALWFFQEVDNEFISSSPKQRDEVEYIHSDVILVKYFEGRFAAGVPLPFLVGAGLHQPGTHPGHFGAVYQDRMRFDSSNTPGLYAQYYG
jgi:hypothetical protein